MTGALAGRTAQLELLDRAVARVAGGGSVVVEVGGEAGLGKTRLLAELGRRAAGAGLLVRSGRATQFEQGVPFGVYEAMAAAPGSRPRVAAGVRRVLTRTTAAGIALLLDDVHWADSASLALTEDLILKPPPVPLLLAVAFRSACPPARLVETIARLGSEAVPIDLPPLGPADLAVLLTGVPRRRRELIGTLSLGNPWYVQALSRLPDHTLEGLAKSPADADWLAHARNHVLAGLAAELAAQEPPVQQVAQVAAVVADHTTIDLVAHVTQLPMDTVAAAVDQLGRLGLIEADGARLAFRHPLMRAATYALTGPARRFETHARTAGYLRSRQASRQVVAHHTEQSARYGDETAAAVLVDAGVAFAHEAPAQAARWLGTALRIMPDGGPRDDRRAAAALWYARALGRSGRLDRSREVLRQLGRAAEPVRGQAATFGVAIARQLGDFPEAAAVLHGQLARSGLDPVGEAKLRVELSAVEAFREDPAAAVHHAQRALELLDRDRSVLVATAHALQALGVLYGGDTTLARRHLTDAVRTLDATGDADLRPYAEIISPLVLTEIQLGNLADAGRHLARARRILGTLGPSSALPYLLVMEVLLHTRAGRLARAVEVADEATAAAERVGSTEMRAMAATVRLRPLLWTAGPAAALAAGAGEAPQSRAWWRINQVEQALVHTVGGDHRGCLEFLADRTAPPSAHPLLLLERQAIAVLAHAGAGDLPAAEDAAGRAKALAAAADPLHARALAGLGQAVAAHRMRRPGRAATLANEAAAGFAAAGMPVEEALAYHLAGAAQLRAGQRGIEAFDRAAAGYTACGARWLSSVLAGHRARVPAPRTTLTRREWEVANLTATGLRNDEIAARLHLSRRTVESHLARIFAKLDVRSRTAMASRLPALAGGN
ncbi:LuxR C-terminal-related transcriptional regulator [Amycolatopsis sp. NPDC049688]|uniref:helix-turn-helix transcriptional regulator n=1 Tax=Amycolatopsis sp. NPDC049688 TaxID=3154733 RepID=UPI003427BE65